MLSRTLRCSLFRRKRLTEVFEFRPAKTRFSTESEEGKSAADSASKEKLGGFAKAFEKFTDSADVKEVRDDVSFATLLRNSKFVDLGDPRGKVVTGTVFHVVKDDLYIDFGSKFHCVCPRPNKNSGEYVRGARVRLRLRELELSTRFLGYDKDLTVLEADASLVSLVRSSPPE